MLVWDVTCPDILIASYTSMEVGVVLAGQRMKTLKYQTISTIHFFVSIRTEILGVFWKKLPPFFLDLGRSIVEEIGEAKMYISSRGSQLRYEGMRHLCWDLQCDYFL